MRWKTGSLRFFKSKPKVGDTRNHYKFAFWPRKLQHRDGYNVTVWLEHYRVHQRFQAVHKVLLYGPGLLFSAPYTTTRWVTIQEENVI